MVSVLFIPTHNISTYIKKKLEQKDILVRTGILLPGMSFGDRSLENPCCAGDRELVRDWSSWPFLHKNHY